jgi:hypothetical protein
MASAMEMLQQLSVGDGMGAVKLHAEYEEYDYQNPTSQEYPSQVAVGKELAMQPAKFDLVNRRLK